MHKKLIKLRAALLVFLTHHLALPVLKLIRKPEKFSYTLAGLHQLPKGTLGYDMAKFLELRGLQLLPFYARHDMKHILLEYEASEEGEGQLQFFMLGNGHVSFPVLATVFYCFATMPEYWPSFKKAFLRGRKSIAISKWNFIELVTQPTADLKNRINLKPIP